MSKKDIIKKYGHLSKDYVGLNDKYLGYETNHKEIVFLYAFNRSLVKVVIKNKPDQIKKFRAICLSTIENQKTMIKILDEI